MKIRCTQCGKEFEPKEPHHKTCWNCFTKSRRPGGTSSNYEERAAQPGRNIQELLLAEYFDGGGNLKKEIFIEVPQKLSLEFSQGNPTLGTKQLRDFHTKILQARNKSVLKGIEPVRPELYRLVSDLAYQVKRNVIPKAFADFMEHHLKLAEKDQESLDAFFQHLDSIVCYYPKI